jgi:hypothetical protein
VAGVPLNQSDLRDAIREWCQLDVNDPRATDAILNDYINAAIHRFQVANPLGWSWDRKMPVANATAWFLGAGVETFFSPLGGGIDEAGGNAPIAACRIRSIELLNDALTYKYPLERVSRDEQLRRFPRDSERRTPHTYSITGYDNGGDLTSFFAVRFRPIPDAIYHAVVWVLDPLGDLSGDNSPNGAGGLQDNQIAQWSDCIVAYAAFLVFRARGDLAESYLGAKQYFDQQVLALRKTNRIRVGAGVGNNPVADTGRGAL